MRILILIILMFLIQKAFAQDTLVTIYGDTMLCKNVVLSKKEIKYRFWNEGKDSTFYAFFKSEVNCYIPRIGEKIDFNPLKDFSEHSDLNQVIHYDACSIGTNDAKTYYNGYRLAGNLVFFGTLLGGPLYGSLFRALSTNSTPSNNNLGIPYAKTDPIYYECYLKEATEIKQKRMKLNYGVAYVGWLSVLITAIAIPISSK